MSSPRQLSNRYELGDTLGYGGMSEVHHGHDVRLGREVAVKVLRADLARDPQFQERFRREAQNAAALNHPAIVAVYDTGETQSEYGPLPYIVMEFVEGRTLRDIVKTEGPMSAKRAMEVMADVCAALDFSHRHGIVHRDVKPANVMITRNGAVKVMDFGIARAVHDGQSAMTQTAAVIGTAQYLSPEQARGEAVDARSDVYAAGCVLYELITGEPPFTGDSPVAVAYQHVREDPEPPSARNSSVTSELDAVVLKALAKGPANRYQSSAEMRSDLVRALSGQRTSAPMVMSADEQTRALDYGRTEQQAFDDYDPDYDDYDDLDERAKRRRRRTWTAVAVTLLALALVAFFVWLFGFFESDPVKKSIPSVTGQTVSSAKQELRNSDFTNFDTREVTCPPLPGQEQQCTAQDVGKVIETDPPEGTTVETSAQVLLVVGAKPPQVTVPDLTGMTVADAKAALKGEDLRLGQVKEKQVDNSEFYGKVLEDGQKPAASAKARAGNTVNITIGKAPPKVPVTDYTGQTYEVAREGLSVAGFNVQRQLKDSGEPKGTVLSQSPSSGKYPKGTTVTLVVSNGSETTFAIPDLTGKTPEQARQALQEQGWTGELDVREQLVTDQDMAGKIIGQDPSAGSEVKKDEDVTVVVARFPGGDDGESTTPTDDDGSIIPGN